MPIDADEVILSDRAESALSVLAKSRQNEAASILARVTYLRERLLHDCQECEVIPLPLRGAARRLAAAHAPFGNLYCCDLPGFWRMLYTIVKVAGRRYVYILEVVDHRTYSRWFPGRAR